MSAVLERLRHFLGATHDPRLELVRHFLQRFFESDLVTTPGQLQTMIVGILAGIGSLGFFLAIRLYRKYIDLAGLDSPELFRRCVLADKLFFIAFAMVIVGFLAALQWHSLFPDLRDYLVLSPLPVTTRQIFATKFVALMLFVSLFVVDVNLPCSLALPAMFSYGHGVAVRWGVASPPGLRVVVAHVISVGAASYFMFFALTGFQGILMNLLSARVFQRCALYLQLVLLLGLLCGVPLLFLIPNLYPKMDQRPEFARYLPPVWFLGLYERLLGSTDPFAARLSQIAWKALAASTLATVALYAISYRRHASRLIESPEGPSRRSVLERMAASLLSKALARPQERAVFSFIWKTMTRSRQHKVFLAAYAGLGCALVLDGFVSLVANPRFHGFAARNTITLQALFSVPLVLSFFLLSGMRYVFALPSELRANWVFRITEDEQRPRLLDAVEKTLLILGVVPVLIVIFPLLLALLGWQLAGMHLAFTLLLSLLLVELMLLDFQKVPFTCSYLPGKRNLSQSALLYWMAFSTYAYATTGFEVWGLLQPGRLAIMACGLAFAIYLLRRTRKEFWGQLSLVFDEIPEPAVLTLGLQPE